MAFTDDFRKSYKQDITQVIQVSDSKIVASEIVSRMAKCIESNFPKGEKVYNKTFICKDVIRKKKIGQADLDFAKESLREPMASLNMSISLNNNDPFLLETRQYSVFTTSALFEPQGFESVSCFVRVANYESV